MNRALFLVIFTFTLGCTEPNEKPIEKPVESFSANPTEKPNAKPKGPAAVSNVQLFNDTVLGSNATDAVPMLLPNETANWSPSQVILDYKEGTCYGAMIHYKREHSFELLRRAINSRFSESEQSSFADDPTMGIWRVEDDGFAIQLSDDKEEDSFVAIYIRFVDSDTLADNLDNLYETDPELFDDFPLDSFTEGLRNVDSADTETSSGR